MTGYFLSSAWTALVLWRHETLPPHAVLFSAMFFLGGGRCVVAPAVNSAVSDVTTDDQRHVLRLDCRVARVADLGFCRAAGFLTIMLGNLAGFFIGPFVSSGLMGITSPWVPYLFSFAVALLGAATLLWIPETWSPEKSGVDKQELMDNKAESMLKRHLGRSLVQLKESLGILRQPALAMVLVTFLAPMPVTAAMSQFLVQYVSKRFQWSLAAAGYLLSLRGIVNMLLLLVILPGLSTTLLAWAAARGQSGAAKDRILAQLLAGHPHPRLSAHGQQQRPRPHQRPRHQHARLWTGGGVPLLGRLPRQRSPHGQAADADWHHGGGGLALGRPCPGRHALGRHGHYPAAPFPCAFSRRTKRR